MGAVEDDSNTASVRRSKYEWYILSAYVEIREAIVQVLGLRFTHHIFWFLQMLYAIGTQSDEEIMYQSMCNTTTGSVGDGKEVGQGQPQFPTQSACMCGFLRDAQPAETQLQSVRGARTSCTNGLATTTNKAYPCKDVDLLSFVSVTELNSAFGSASDRLNDIWGWTDPFTCTEIALVGTASGTAFVDITDPVNPKYLGKLPTRSGSSPWRDIKTYKNHAYIVSEASNHGLQVSLICC